MTEPHVGRFKMVIMQYGPIPPSGGPLRDRYLDSQGKTALDVAAAEYEEALSHLGAAASSMPVIDFPLVEADENARAAIQWEKRAQWIGFRNALDATTLDGIEPHARRSTKAAIDALNYLEDNPLREEAHAAIHRAAFMQRGLFGCPITYRDGEYWSGCPINISHLRMGVSAGLVAEMECSICGELIEDCDHQPGQTYPRVAARDGTGICNLCDSHDCEHSPGDSFPVRAHGVARSVTASEVSLVPRPRYPLARIVEQTRDLGPLHDNPAVRRAAEHLELNCDADLGPCKGLNEMRDWHRDGVSRFERDTEHKAGD